MKIDHPSAPLTAAHVPAYLTGRRDPAINSAARNALARLTLLAKTLAPDDLVLHALASGQDPAQALPELVASLDAALASIKQARTSAEALLRADQLERHALDATAMELLGYANVELQHHQRQAAAVERGAARESDRLRDAGLSPAEVEALMTVRDGRPDPQIAAHREKAKACAERVAALDAFLADRLRSTAALPDDLLAELRERAAAMKDRGVVPGEWLEREAKAVKDAGARDRLIARLTGKDQHAEAAQG